MRDDYDEAVKLEGGSKGRRIVVNNNGSTRTARRPATRVKVSPEEARGGHDRRRESPMTKKASHARHARCRWRDDDGRAARRPLNGWWRTTSATLTMLAKLKVYPRRCWRRWRKVRPPVHHRCGRALARKACPWCRPGFAGLVDVLLLMWLAILLEWRRLCTPRRRRCRITSTRGTAHQ